MCDTGQAMRGGIRLLLLAVSVLLARCQQKPTVSMSPNLTEIFSGDLFYLSCNNGMSPVEWYFEGKKQPVTTKTWRVASASSNHSGSYQCESNGQKSDGYNVTINAYVPRALLTIKTGHPVMKNGSSVVLNLYNDNRLRGWNCWVYRGDRTKKRIVLKTKDDPNSLDFQPRRLEVPETIFWCTDEAKQVRSNQITVWTSDKEILLEMYNLPAVTGESLTLRCLVWGTNRITRATFYKDNAIILEGTSPTYTIPVVTESAKGKYKCDATFTYKDSTGGLPYQLDSDHQELLVQVASMKAVLSKNAGLSCSCPSCPGVTSYHWYRNDDDNGQPSRLIHSGGGFMMPTQSGTYACRAVWDKGMSFLSNSYIYKPPIIIILVLVVVGLVIILSVCALAVYLWYKKRNATGPIYEDVALRTRDKGDDKYEALRGGAGRDGEYDTLGGEGAAGGAGGYEALRKEGMKGEVYHTLGGEGASGGAGGYEALKKEGMKEGEYDTLGGEGASGGAGGYEALKKEGMKGEVYHTLGGEGAEGGAGGYEALKKEGMKGEVYHTLGGEGAEGGAGGYEALKKEGMKGEVYHTLGGEGAGGGAGEYEALKKEGMKGEVYHTLGGEGAGGGAGGYEAVKTEGMKEGVYHTLGGEGAGGGE